MKREGASFAEGPDDLIVALPRQAKVKTIIFILDAEPVANRLESIRQAGRVLLLVGEVDHRRPEDRPVMREMEPPGEPQFLLVAQILEGRIDIAVEPQIAGLDIGFGSADGEIDLVAADREIVLVEPVAVRDVDQRAEPDSGPADDVAQAIGQAGAVGKQSWVAG